MEIVKQVTPDEAKLLHLDGAPAPQLATISVKMEAPASGTPGQTTVLERLTTLGEEAGCAFPDLTRNYLENLARLGLLELDEDKYWTSALGVTRYSELEAHPTIEQLKRQIEAIEGQSVVIQKGIVQVTAYGAQFISSVVRDRVDRAGRREVER